MMMRSLLVLGAAVLLGLPDSAAAQPAPAPVNEPGLVGVGLSFLGNGGGTGVSADLSMPVRRLSGGQLLGWVGDVSLHKNGYSGFGYSTSATALALGGGARVSGEFSEKATWHAQGILGVFRVSYSSGLSGANDDFCEAFGLDCDLSGSATNIFLAPGGGINYWFNERTAFRAQLDIPIGNGGSTSRFWIGISRRIGQ